MPSVVSIATGRKPQSARRGEYLLLELDRPGERVRTIGVLLRDAESGQIYSKIRRHWEDIPEPEEQELLAALDEDFQSKIGEMGGEEFLRSLEDSLSNALRLSERTAVAVDDF